MYMEKLPIEEEKLFVENVIDALWVSNSKGN